MSTNNTMYICPYCGEKVLFIGVHDDEGNYHGRIGCEYELDPCSGLSYGIHHEGWGSCILCTDSANSIMGGVLFDTAKEAENDFPKNKLFDVPDICDEKIQTADLLTEITRLRNELEQIKQAIHGDCDYCKNKGTPLEGPCKSCVSFAAKPFIDGDYWEYGGSK